MLIRVPTVKTDFSVFDFVKSLIKSWFADYQEYPSKASVGVVYSQWGVETGVGKYCWNSNFGNIKAIDIPGQTVKYVALIGVWEIVNGKKVILDKENPGAWFRAFDSLDEGMLFHLNFLRNKRYKSSWTAVEQGDPVLFAKLLRKQGYYTAPEANYVAAMQYHFSRFMKDNTFEMALEAVKQEKLDIEFPNDWKPVSNSTFDVKEDVFEKSKMTKTSGLVDKIVFIIKRIFGN